MRSSEFITEKWTAKYKRSINCNSPKGFSQRAHCQGRKKKTNEGIFTEAQSNKLFKYIETSLKNAGYKKLGTGIDATVWMKDQGTVVKIIMPDFDPESSIGRMQAFYKFPFYQHQSAQETKMNPLGGLGRKVLLLNA